MDEGQHQPGNRGKRYSKADRQRFFYLVYAEDGPGFSISKAAKEMQIAYSTVRNWAGKFDDASVMGRQKGLRDLPHPIEFKDLCDDAKYALEDFALFRYQYFLRDEQVWSNKAAYEILDAIADTSHRSFIDLNVFPGAGKTFTMHDIVIWLICGGGTMDPAWGRAMRTMLGSNVTKVAKHMLLLVRRDLERHRPYYDKDKREYAPKTLSIDFGRFRPDRGFGEESIWRDDQFLVAQVGEFDVYEKEPTVQIASEESGFVGERVNLGIWDDIAVSANSKGPEQQRNLGKWFEDEAEQRIEPGGTLVLVGQRFSSYDLHRHRLNARVVVDETTGREEPLYRHITFPAHHDAFCDADTEGGSHRQWNGGTSGCMTDITRLNVRDWMSRKSAGNYQTLMQQQDVDPGNVLVEMPWITGGVDSEGFDAPGCFDKDRGWGEHPTGTPKLVDYVSVDPSVSNWWALEWWAYCPATRYNYLIWGIRQRMTAGKLLDWDNPNQVFTGHMEKMQTSSTLGGHPIRVWILESNAAHKYLQQNTTFHRWKQKWSGVRVIAHETQRNKLDPDMGLTGLLPGRYRTGMKRIPHRPGEMPRDGGFIDKHLIPELTTYSLAEDAKNYGYDTVLSDWIGETNLNAVIMAGKRTGEQYPHTDAKVPEYLTRRRREFAMAKEA